MKIIDIHQDTNKLIELALQSDRQAQKVLYTKYSPKFLSICRQYMPDIHLAEDVMVTAFMKIFSHLNLFENRGSFEGWMRRIVVNECISFIRANKRINYLDDQTSEVEAFETSDCVVLTEDVQILIDQLPQGCKMVFNLYAIEGFKHQEIAEMLSISEGTSKSQLAYARRLLQNWINTNNKINHG